MSDPVTADFFFWYTCFILAATTSGLLLEIFEIELIIFSALVLLLLGGVITIEEAFEGFSNPGVLTVGFLYVVATSLKTTGIFERFSSSILGGNTGSNSMRMNRILFPVAGLSAFLNNTPIIALLIPAVKSWCKRNNIASSRFLLPLSYAAILGGTCTLIGTSTNLVIHGFLINRGYEGFSFFELALVGVPVAVIGILLVSFFLYKLLPERKEATVVLGEYTREFVIELKVNNDFPYIGRTIEEAGLRHLQGLFIFQIERNGIVKAPVGSTEKVMEGDRLFFTGVPETIIELQKRPGLDVVDDRHFDLKNYDSDELKMYEVVNSPSSPLIGKTVRESNFRGYYDAVILAIHRNGHRINKKIGDIKLEIGDTLLILADKDFHKRWYHSRDFYLISTSNQIPSKPKVQTYITLGIAILMITVVTAGIIPIIVASGAAAVLLVLSRTINIEDVFKGVEWRILLTIASAFGIANAIDNSGVAAFFAAHIFNASVAFGSLGLVAAVYIVTSLYTEIITNNAAAVLLFPIALSVGLQAELDVMPFAYAVVFGASAGFATPIGYQTNLMVQGPGQYRMKDYLKVGIPLKICIAAVTITMIKVLYF
jgi:di/tricarboxylate transporter